MIFNMKKMKTIFRKDKDNKMTKEIEPTLSWVLKGEGTARIKLDGTACKIINGLLYKRYDRKLNKKGDRKIAPAGFIPCNLEPDLITNHWPGWAPITGSSEDKWHREAFEAMLDNEKEETTYELIGPKIQGNLYELQSHVLLAHNKLDIVIIPNSCLTYDKLRIALKILHHEGIVFSNNKTGEMGKLRRSDFGYDWPLKK